MSGSQNGRIHVWSADTGEEVTVLDGGHPHPSHCVQFNPKFMMIASSCKSIVSIMSEGARMFCYNIICFKFPLHVPICCILS